MWCLYRFYQRNKSRCRCKWDVTIEYLTRATFEKQLTALHVFILLTNKCGLRPKLFLRLDIFLTLVDHITLTYLRKSFIPDNKLKKTCYNDGIWTRPWPNTNDFPRSLSQGIAKHTQNRPQLIFSRNSSRDSTEQTNPEKYNRHTQQIMNLATQLAVKGVLKSKCLVQFINTSSKIFPPTFVLKEQ